MVNGLPDAMRVVFDDQRAVANAGLLLPAVLADRLGIEALVDETVDLGDRLGAAHPGRKVMTLMSAMALGADCIDDCELLRSGQTRTVLGHGVSAPSTVGTFSAGVHVWACPPARPRARGEPCAGVGRRSRSRPGSAGRGCRQLRG